MNKLQVIYNQDLKGFEELLEVYFSAEVRHSLGISYVIQNQSDMARFVFDMFDKISKQHNPNDLDFLEQFFIKLVSLNYVQVNNAIKPYGTQFPDGLKDADILLQYSIQNGLKNIRSRKQIIYESGSTRHKVNQI